jgi:N-acetylmuramoyl-L-alanine amidase
MKSIQVMVITATALLAAFVTTAAGTDARPVDRAASRPLAGMTINIDPGHNPGNAKHPAQINRIVHAGPMRKACDTAGASTNDGFPEHRFALQLATRVVRRLRAVGATVTLTHNAIRPAWGPCITQRAAIGNRADAAISLHADGNNARTAHGFHVIRPGFVRGYTGDIVKRSSTLATALRTAMLDHTRLTTSTYIGSRGLDVRTDLGGLVLSDVPKVFLEAGNMRNAGDAAKLRDPKSQERIATAIVAAFIAWHRAES